MRFVTFREKGQEGGPARAGVLTGEAVCDLAHPAMLGALGGVAADVGALVVAGLAGMATAIARHGLAPDACRPLGGLRLLAPYVPGRIFGFAHNYTDAIAERGAAPPAEPTLFMKDPRSVIGPGDPIVLPAGIGGVTYEAEVAAVIGTRAEGVSPADALSYVAAYAVFNDISASEMIRREGSFDRGKNLPGFGPFGPFLVTADEVPDPQALRLGLTSNGTVRQDGTTATMLFGVAALVSILSHQGFLLPGDLIATGTPAGAAPAQKPPTWIQPGDTLCAWAEGLGSLTNPVIRGPALHG